MVIRGWPEGPKTDRAGDVVGMGWFGLVVSVDRGCGCIVGDGRRADEGWLGSGGKW